MPVLDRSSLQELAEDRLEDARILMTNQRYAAAHYLAGYSVECALKACIARQTRENEFPDKGRVNASYTHDLAKPLGVAQISWNKDVAADPELRDNWALVSNTWSELGRYENACDVEARDLIRAIGDPVHGVLQWLQKYW